jgi:hypothetical protein
LIPREVGVEDDCGSILRGRRGRGQRRRHGGGVEVDDGSAIMTKSLRKGMTATCSEAGVEAATCSGAGDEVMVCSGAGIEDDRWRRRHGGF